MIRILETSKELTKIEKYLMTLSPDINVIKNIPDEESIDVKAWCIFEDEKEDGDVVELLSIIDNNNKVYSCQSKTFKKTFMDIFNTMDGDAFSIIKKSGTTKAGRPYVNCVLDVSKL